MGDYTGLRFKGIVKKEFRNKFEDIAINGAWKKSPDKILKEFGVVFNPSIPNGYSSYMPDEWKDQIFRKIKIGIPTDGFDKTYDKGTGLWTFQCSLKNYNYSIQEFFKILPHFIESVEHLEYYFEGSKYSEKYDLIDNEIVLVNGSFICYREDY